MTAWTVRYQGVGVILEKVSEITTHRPSFFTAIHVNFVLASVEITKASVPV